MYTHPTAAIAILFVLQPLVLTANDLPRPANNQSDPTVTDKTSSEENTPMSDREKAGLRGPVQQCIEERTTPAFDNFPGTSYVSINTYSPEGSLLQSSTGNSVESAQESSTTYTYDSAGRLLKKNHHEFWFARVRIKLSVRSKRTNHQHYWRPAWNFHLQIRR